MPLSFQNWGALRSHFPFLPHLSHIPRLKVPPEVANMGGALIFSSKLSPSKLLIMLFNTLLSGSHLHFRKLSRIHQFRLMNSFMCMWWWWWWEGCKVIPMPCVRMQSTFSAPTSRNAETHISSPSKEVSFSQRRGGNVEKASGQQSLWCFKNKPEETQVLFRLWLNCGGPTCTDGKPRRCWLSNHMQPHAPWPCYPVHCLSAEGRNQMQGEFFSQLWVLCRQMLHRNMARGYVGALSLYWSSTKD